MNNLKITAATVVITVMFSCMLLETTSVFIVLKFPEYVPLKHVPCWVQDRAEKSYMTLNCG